jgi:hypothetical protein
MSELRYTKTALITRQDLALMADSYTTLWSSERCRRIKQTQQEGATLALLFGGPHTSEPSFRRAGVKAGDSIYPIRVHQGIYRLSEPSAQAFERLVLKHEEQAAG